MNTIYILWLRQLKRYVRSKPRILASLGQPLLFSWGSALASGPYFRRPGRAITFSFSRLAWWE